MTLNITTMKNVFSIATVLAVFALGALPAKSDLLVNGNFNSGDLTGWWTYVADANSSITVVTDAGLAFDGSPYVYGMLRDTSPDPILGQDISLTPGMGYNVSLQYRGTTWGGAGVGIYYFDSAWAQVGWEWATLYNGDGTDTGWKPFTSPTWTTPANTAYVEVRLDGWGWSDTYYDNVTLDVVPEPASGALLVLGGLLVIGRRFGARR